MQSLRIENENLKKQQQQQQLHHLPQQQQSNALGPAVANSLTSKPRSFGGKLGIN